MQEKLGWSIRPEKAAIDLVNKQGKRLIKIIRRLGERILAFLLPKQLEDFSTPGEWHKKKKVDKENLFSDLLVAMSGRAESWIALEQALIIAKLEQADVRGLVIENHPASRGINTDDITRAFNERLSQSGISGNLAFAKGNVPETICERARFTDLVVLKLSYPPSANIFSRFNSGMRLILRQSSRPILVVRKQIRPLEHLLLAYDGSPKGREALYLAAYFSSRYDKKLSVLVVDDDMVRGQKLISEAKAYLGKTCYEVIHKRYSHRTSNTILQVAEEESVDMIMMGGYGLSPLFEALFGSTVDGVLRGTQVPVLICQ
jgi:nucleotide-binding universal stress UspA family protein